MTLYYVSTTFLISLLVVCITVIALTVHVPNEKVEGLKICVISFLHVNLQIYFAMYLYTRFLIALYHFYDVHPQTS